MMISATYPHIQLAHGVATVRAGELVNAARHWHHDALTARRKADRLAADVDAALRQARRLLDAREALEDDHV